MTLALPSPAVASWRDAVQAVPGGVRLLLEAQPGASQERFPDGFNPWRGRIGVRVRAPARDGKANAAVLASVAAFFAVPGTAVALEAGALDSRKSVVVRGLAQEAAHARLAPALEGM